jgi:UDP-N-acetylmuramate--alanine ligase
MGDQSRDGASVAPIPMNDLGRVHILGIGGAGMSGIARILQSRGLEVSGTDAKDSRRVQALRALGVRVEVGHAAENLGSAQTVIASTAVHDDNVELVAARERGLRVLRRPEALGALAADYRTVAVAGTHGKTTTTSMLTVALQAVGADPSFAIGSELAESGSNAHVGSGDLFVVEADESDGTFLYLNPVASIVTNVEADHLDHWGTFDAIEAAFVDFARRSDFLVVCADDPGSARLAVAALAEGIDVRTYGEAEDADLRILDVEPAVPGWSFAVAEHGVILGRAQLQVPGRHNVLNAVAALATGMGLGFSATELLAGLESFAGTRRRFEYRGTADGVRVYDDYAHHPTEIAATLRAAREVVGDGRVVVAFQAHHYYRTAMFTKEFGEALGLADEVIVLEVFAPGETPIPGASGQSMAANVPLPAENVVFEPSWSEVSRHLADRARPGDIVMTLGAGDIGLLAPEVLERLESRTVRTDA